jgi:hypothetical protein
MSVIVQSVIKAIVSIKKRKTDAGMKKTEVKDEDRK